MIDLKNIIEEMVNKEIDLIYQRLVDICKCNQCRNDAIALTLNKIPAQYVTGKRGIDKVKNNIFVKYNNKIPQMLIESIEVVNNNPRPECEKIKGISNQSYLLFSNQNTNIEFYNP